MDAVTGPEATWRDTPGSPAWPPLHRGATAAYPGSAERLLHDAAERATRHPQGKLALVLHLSRLRPPAPRPHHLRIGRAILQDAAHRYEGQVFALRNGDLVLLCRAASEVLGLPEMLGRLLRLDAPDPAALHSLWRLEQAADRLLDYAAARLADRLPAPREAAQAAAALASPLAVEAVEAVLRQARWPDVTQRQTAALLTIDRTTQNPGVRPLFCEVGFAIAGLEARAGAASADPYLFRHLARRLDGQMLRALAEAFGSGSPLDAARRPAPPFHVNLTLPTLLSPAFAAFAGRCRAAGATLGAEVALIEASADVTLFARARRFAVEAGIALVLDGVTHHALLLSRPWVLGADLVKLDWSATLPQLAAAEQAELEAALQAVGPARLVLQRAEDEVALRWGFARGIRRFQGRHVDAMLAASRLLGCTAASGCTLRQCVERAAATGVAARRFCHRPDLLDAGIPPGVAALPQR